MTKTPAVKFIPQHGSNCNGLAYDAALNSLALVCGGFCVQGYAWVQGVEGFAQNVVMLGSEKVSRSKYSLWLQ